MPLVGEGLVLGKLKPNDRNMPTQHIATLLGATCGVCLAKLLQHFATCWVLLAQILPFPNLSQQHPTCRNVLQHGGQTCATCCAQQSCDMLRSFGWGLRLDTYTSAGLHVECIHTLDTHAHKLLSTK